MQLTFDIVEWLERSPAVASWFARIIGKLPDTGVVSLDEWWDNWSGATNPRISSELVLAGRQDQVRNIQEWLAGKAAYMYIKEDTRDEALAFTAAVAHSHSETPEGAGFLSKAVVVESAEAWRNLEGHHLSLVLIRNFIGNVSSLTATRNGHHVLTLLDKSQIPYGEGITLPRLGRHETVSALCQMDMTELEARQLSLKTGRHLAVLRRMLLDESGFPRPRWTEPQPSRTLISAMLIGQWDESRVGDKDIVADISGKPYEEIEQELTILATMADAPLGKFGNHWSFKCREESWYLLAPFLAVSEVRRFRDLAIKVLSNRSPQFDLPLQERYLAPVRGAVLSYSDILLEGITQTLALMGTQPSRMQHIEGASSTARQVIQRGLQGATDWRVWATLDGNLLHLAEAAPEEFIDAVENALIEYPEAAAILFQQDNHPVLGGAPHVGLLWALERLAWSSDHFSRVTIILGKLAELDKGSGVANRPLASLVELFRPWIRFTEATDDERLTTLELLTEKCPDSGWRVLVRAFPSRTSNISNRNTQEVPRWRPWGPDGVSDVTLGERQKFCEGMCQILLKRVGKITYRWKDLVGMLADLPMMARLDVIKLLIQNVDVMPKDANLTELRTPIRRELHRQCAFSDTQVAMGKQELKLLEIVYEKLTPESVTEDVMWIFDHSPCLPDVMFGDEAYEAKVVNAREEAVQKIYSFGGTEALLDLLGNVKVPAYVGTAVASSLDVDAVLSIAIECLSDDLDERREFAQNFFRQSFHQAGWAIVDKVLSCVKRSEMVDPLIVATVYFAASPRDMTTCLQRLQSEASSIQRAYWSRVDERFILWSELDSQDYSKCITHLLNAGRSLSVARVLIRRPMPSSVVIQVLEQIPHDRIHNADPASSGGGLASYWINQLFEQLDAADDVVDEVVARLEISYFYELKQERKKFAFYREIARAPSLFAELIYNAFKSEGDKGEETSESIQGRERIAMLSFDILEYNRDVPGLQSDGKIDVAVLDVWVTEARQKCVERGRGVIGDQYIGKLLANSPADPDGLWPCEPVREVLEAVRDREHLGIGFHIGKRNLRGFVRKDVYEGGDQERQLALQFLEHAEKCRVKWPYTAKVLRQLAHEYEADANFEDEKAMAREELGL